VSSRFSTKFPIVARPGLLFEFGESVTYRRITSAGESLDSTITVMIDRSPPLDTIFADEPAPGWIVRVQKSKLTTAPVSGDQVQIDGTFRRVQLVRDASEAQDVYELHMVR